MLSQITSDSTQLNAGLVSTKATESWQWVCFLLSFVRANRLNDQDVLKKAILSSLPDILELSKDAKSSRSSLYHRQIVALQEKAEECFKKAEDQKQSYWGYEYCLRSAFYYVAAKAIAEKNKLNNEVSEILIGLAKVVQTFPRLAFEKVSWQTDCEVNSKMDCKAISSTNSSTFSEQLLAKQLRLLKLRDTARQQLDRYKIPKMERYITEDENAAKTNIASQVAQSDSSTTSSNCSSSSLVSSIQRGTQNHYQASMGSQPNPQLLLQSLAQLPLASQDVLAPSKLTMQGIYKEITNELKKLLIDIIAESIDEYQKTTGIFPPCDYAFISFGSLARDEITPYSDLEFGILIADSNDTTKSYFCNLSRLINVKLLLLGETPASTMGKDFQLPEVKGKKIPNPIPKGVCFDARVDGGCKNPLGKRDEKGNIIFELIGMPEVLADYQDERHYEEKGNLRDESFLASALAQGALIVGGKKNGLSLDQSYGQDLIADYQKEVDRQLQKKVRRLWEHEVNLSLRQVRALKLLINDIARFRPKLGKLESNARLYSVKHDLCRIFNTIFDQLALFYQLPDTNVWDRLTTLCNKQIFSMKSYQHLQQAIDKALFYRLKIYYELGEQNENLELTREGVTFKAYSSSNVFSLSEEDIFDIYYTVIPFWEAARGFRDGYGEAKVFADPRYKSFYDSSLLMKGKIKLLLEGYPQALHDFRKEIKLVTQNAKEAADEKNKKEAEINRKEAKDQKVAANSSINQDVQSLEMAQLFQAAGQASRAVDEGEDKCNYLKQAIEIYEKYGTSFAPELSECYLDLALTLQMEGQTETAQQYLKKAKNIIIPSYGKGHPYFAYCEYVAWCLEQPAGSMRAIRNRELAESWQLPPNNDTYFVRRENELEKLRNHFKRMEASRRVVLSILSGLGGIGKTQIAIQYIHNPEQSYAWRFWFHADTATILFNDYLALAKQFALVKIGKQDEEKADKDFKKNVIFAVKRHLNNYQNWLAVYDNAGRYSELEPFIPNSGGHLIITTRLEEWHDVVTRDQVVKVDVFTEPEAIECVENIIKIKYSELGLDEQQAIKSLIPKWGGLPLAIAQAGAYIYKRKITIAKYLNYYEQNAKEMLSDKTLPAHSEANPVAITWNISLQAIKEDEEKDNDPKISELILRAMSYLYSKQIPRDLIEVWLEEKRLVTKTEAEKRLNKAIGHLSDYSMVQVDITQGTISVHCLVQEVLRLPTIIEEDELSTKVDKKTDNVIGGSVDSRFYLASLAISLDKKFNCKFRDEKDMEFLLPHMQVSRTCDMTDIVNKAIDRL